MGFKNGMRPVHPGEVLREDYLKPLEMSVNALAKQLGIPTSRLANWLLIGSAKQPSPLASRGSFQ